ncbi:hypothetical protein L6V77_26405 [Myxococcota bacterium]|nr:hypothetical protein [Myxococcota bacterium]
MGPATRPERPRRRRGRLFWVLTAFALAAVVAAAIGYFRFVEFVETDPAFCARCHPIEPELLLWTRSQHRKIRCQSCHHESEEGALGILRAFAFQRTNPDGSSYAPHTQTLVVETCGGCHLSHDPSWPQIGQSTGHLVHVNRQGESCLRCHGESIHGVGGPGETCRECHRDRMIVMDAMGDDHCLACHNFMTTQDTLAPPRDRCLNCHRRRGVEMPAFPENAPMARQPCSDCHRPHANASNVFVPCAKCHEETLSHGLHAHPKHDVCGTCHQAHTWDTRQAQCIACHAEPVDHHRDQRCWSCHSFRAAPLVPVPGLKVAP